MGQSSFTQTTKLLSKVCPLRYLTYSCPYKYAFMKFMTFCILFPLSLKSSRHTGNLKALQVLLQTDLIIMCNSDFPKGYLFIFHLWKNTISNLTQHTLRNAVLIIPFYLEHPIRRLGTVLLLLDLLLQASSSDLLVLTDV